MGYTGRIVLVAVAAAFSLVSIFLFEESLSEELPTFVIVGVLAWFFGQQFDKVKFLSEKDFLTNLYNRRSIYQLFPKWNRKYPYISVLVIDINNFKEVNDERGHGYGDYVLKRIAQFICSHVRKTDIVARWGGDEFLVICPNADREETEKIVNRLLRQFEEEKETHHLGANLGLAIGQALFPAEGKGLDELVRVADGKMYANKMASKGWAETRDAASCPEAAERVPRDVD